MHERIVAKVLRALIILVENYDINSAILRTAIFM